MAVTQYAVMVGSDHALLVEPPLGGRVTIGCGFPGTLYYGDTPATNATNNNGSLTVFQNATFNRPQYMWAAGQGGAVSVTLYDGSPPTYPGVFNVDDFGADPSGTSDCTAAVQSCIDACVAAGGGKVQFGAGSYKFTTPPSIRGNSNACLHLPSDGVTSGELEIAGINKRRTNLFTQFGTLSYNASNGSQSFIGGGTPTLMDANAVANNGMCLWNVYMHDMQINTETNPTYSGVDLRCMVRVMTERMEILGGNYAVAAPTNIWTFGLAMPRRLNYGTIHSRLDHVAGFYVGFVIGTSHTMIENTIADKCNVAYGLDGTGNDPHGMTFTGAQCQECIHGLIGWTEAAGFTAATGELHIQGNLDMEVVNTGAFAFQSHLSDANNVLYGELWLLLTLAGTGNDQAISVAGCTNLRLRNYNKLSTGTATLASGTVTVANTSIAATSKVGCGIFAPSANAGAIFVKTVTAGTSFVLASTNASDTSTVWWTIDR